MKRQPCPTCPWRVDQHAQDIPNFDLALAEGLVATTADGFGAPIFACHQSRPGKDIICLGWLVRHGWDSIAVRLRLARGVTDPDDLESGADWPELHDNYGDVLEKLRRDTEVES